MRKCPVGPITARAQMRLEQFSFSGAEAEKSNPEHRLLVRGQAPALWLSNVPHRVPLSQ